MIKLPRRTTFILANLRPFRLKIFGHWVLPLLLALIGFVSIVGCGSVAWAADKLFSWQGERGYHLDCIRLPQTNPPKYEFIFTAPDRRVLGIYHSTDPNPYLQLHLVGFDQHPWGELDVGGQKPGDLFLKGTVGQPLQLIKILSSQKEIVLDQGELASVAPT
jgi:hypothetical protein